MERLQERLAVQLDQLRVSADHTAYEGRARQLGVIVRFERFDLAHRVLEPAGDIGGRETPLGAGLPQQAPGTEALRKRRFAHS
ncbi:MAG: hypothetical protein A3I00_03350 [Betaproteobacteria bacterium RIFCSPLOWO2_02_FULL_64_12]|nr:MAG: hypothetical protein A3I00_03350 [Betaproteobacteria bacterium RIFCSPLOWO2_02_FULL_64_12]